MMNFDDFSAWAEKRMQEQHPTQKILVQDIVKLNGTYTGLVVLFGEKTGPVINLEEMYAAYLQCESKEMIFTRMEHDLQQRKPDISLVLKDYDAVKDHLFLRVSSLASISETLLKSIPYQVYADLAVTYAIAVDEEKDSIASITVTNAMLERFGISMQQLQEDAMSSSRKILPAVIAPIEKVLFDWYPENGGTLYLISNRCNTYGASAMFYPDVLDRVTRRLGGDLILLPSSIHEVIAMSATCLLDYAKMKKMVQDVNKKYVSAADQLSNNVYHYDASEHLLETVEEYLCRKVEQNRGKMN